MTLKSGTTLGEFKIVGGIRGGKFCEVYKAVRIDDPTGQPSQTAAKLSTIFCQWGDPDQSDYCT